MPRPFILLDLIILIILEEEYTLWSYDNRLKVLRNVKLAEEFIKNLKQMTTWFINVNHWWSHRRRMFSTRSVSVATNVQTEAVYLSREICISTPKFKLTNGQKTHNKSTLEKALKRERNVFGPSSHHPRRVQESKNWKALVIRVSRGQRSWSSRPVNSMRSSWQHEGYSVWEQQNSLPEVSYRALKARRKKKSCKA
jgi:hypothetical protein